MRVYISGKIGEEVISDTTRQKFARAEEMLKAKGFEVFNPTSEKWQESLRKWYEKDRRLEERWIEGTFPDFYGYCLLRDLMVLATKDAVYFLDDWDKSDGANTEHSYAMAAKKKLLWQRLEDAQVFHDDDETAEEVWLPI